MGVLGIYFGPKIISVVEVAGKRILKNFQIPSSAFSTVSTDDKIPEEIKIVALFKEGMRRERIESKDAYVTFSVKDLIIRTFSMPVLPASELNTAINFEAKKYIPFKIEELISSFQSQLDKSNNRNSVLFVGIKKEILEKYVSIFNQLELKVNSLEYSAFSIIRLIEMSGIKEKGVVGIINIDSQECDEADFTVLENGFPLFSCDIKLSSVSHLGSKTVEVPGMSTEKLKSEIRISLDYYNHKFPTKKIRRVFLIGNTDSRAIIEPFIQDFGLSFRYIEPAKIVAKAMPFSLSFLKAYGSALFNTVKSTVKINVFLSWQKSKQIKGLAEHPKELLFLISSGLKINTIAVILGVLMCVAGFGVGYYPKVPLKQEKNSIIAARPKVFSANPESAIPDLEGVLGNHNQNKESMLKLLKNQLYFTPQLSSLPALIPKGMWLTSMDFKNTPKGPEFVIVGNVALENSNQELELVNSLLRVLKKDKTFGSLFKDIRINSLETAVFEDKAITKFVIIGIN